ncbi:helix-turn-helix domain-containing protein [Aestuariibacter sp. AA17]|uniref:Helix-turn-helix domain-containing protein n=1 Tax=Fluctibacter corallii TaxID=2984329 RepID=A0ABT3AB45_9ALTE|nr:helix-turn-helix domain-containing protein [Aestuariibacter sp. AA17]MCV2885517.1 helix-turn-helix domain-containing protein [Aestuariibacter sp. AA17]
MDVHEMLNQSGVKRIIAAFDLLPDILFWVKDRESRIIYGNEEFVHHQGFKHLDQVRLKTDYDFSPKHLAHQFVNDDKRVLNGQQVSDRLELNYTTSGELGWFSTSKRVLTNDDNDVIGTYGITRHLEKTSKALSHVHAIEAPVKFIRQHFSDNISVEQLAELAHLSISALERRFKKHLAKTPNQFINETRLENARKLLVETRLPIGEVAYQCGFSDPSYFSKQFQLLFGEKPSTLRKHVDN